MGDNKYVYPMDTTQARNLAVKAMYNHGLTQNGWVFQWDNAKGRFGICKHRYRVLSFSKFLTEHSEEEAFMATVMHEIAHALVGPGKGHGMVWRMKMLELGQNPKRTKETSDAQRVAIVESANWTLTCAASGKVLGKMHRKRNRKICLCHNTPVLWNGRPF